MFQAIGKEIREHKGKVRTFLEEKESMMSEHQDFMKRKAKLELDIKDIQEQLDGDSSAKVNKVY